MTTALYPTADTKLSLYFRTTQMTDYCITIGILTYNRCNSLAASLDQLLASQLIRENAKILIVDDGSTDQTSRLLSSKEKSDDGIGKYELATHRNHKNLGYGKSFVRAFEECDSEYIMMMTDDDHLIIDNLLDVLSFLRRVSPDFVSPQSLSREGRRDRGCSSTRLILPTELINCSALAPGLIYKTKEAKPLLSFITRKLNEGCVFTAMYPQVVLAMSLLLKSKSCWHFSSPIFQERDRMPSGIRDSGGNSYSSFTSRIHQASAFEKLVLEFEECSQREQVLFSVRFFYIGVLLRADSRIQKTIYLHMLPNAVRRLAVRLIPEGVKNSVKRYLIRNGR